MREHIYAVFVIVLILVVAQMFGRADAPKVAATIPFESDTAIGDDGRVALERVIMMLYGDPSAKALITGHTWPGNDTEAGLRLAKQRGRDVANEMMARGITKDRIRLTRDARVTPLPGGCDAALSERACQLKHTRAEVLVTRGH